MKIDLLNVHSVVGSNLKMKGSQNTVGGYADYWYELEYEICNFIWRSEKKS